MSGPDYDEEFVERWLHPESDSPQAVAPRSRTGPATGLPLVVAVWERAQQANLGERLAEFASRPQTVLLAEFPRIVLEEAAKQAMNCNPDRHLLLSEWLAETVPIQERNRRLAAERRSESQAGSRRATLARSLEEAGRADPRGVWVDGVLVAQESRLCRVCFDLPDRNNNCACGTPTLRQTS